MQISMAFECKLNEHNVISKVRRKKKSFWRHYNKCNNNMGNWSRFNFTVDDESLWRNFLIQTEKKPGTCWPPWEMLAFFPITCSMNRKKIRFRLEISMCIVYTVKSMCKYSLTFILVTDLLNIILVTEI